MTASLTSDDQARFRRPDGSRFQGRGRSQDRRCSLAKFISLLNEYVGFAGKVGKRLRDDKVTELLPRSISQNAPISKETRTRCPRSFRTEKALKAISK